MAQDRFRVSLIDRAGLYDQLGSFADEYVGKAGFGKFNRAAQFSFNDVARSTVKGIAAGLSKAIDHPTSITSKAFAYRLGDLKAAQAGADPFAEVYVQPLQSTWLKYLTGEDDENVRLPGDLGLAQKSILLPIWSNIEKTQGVKQNQYGNVPTSFIARLMRESRGIRAKSRKGTSWGVYWGKMKIDGQEAEGLIARPPRGREGAEAERTTFRTSRTRRVNGGVVTNLLNVPKVVNYDVPRMLLLKVPKATYEPILQTLMDAQTSEAVKSLPELMARELADNLAHMASKGTKKSPYKMAPMNPSTPMTGVLPTHLLNFLGR